MKVIKIKTVDKNLKSYQKMYKSGQKVVKR